MAGAINQSIPGPNQPLVTRDRFPTSVWYPWFSKIIDFVNGIANGELIVDGAITSRTMAAGAVTADVVAAGAITADAIAVGAVTTQAIASGAITADSGIIADAAIGTLKLAGNSVTQAVSAFSGTQIQLSSTSYTTIASLTMTVSGTQPIIVWGTFIAGGARLGSAGSFDFIYDGNYWLNNTTTTYITTRVLIGATASAENEEMSVLAREALNIPYVQLLSGLSAGSYTVAIQAKKVNAGQSHIGIRDVTLAALEVKR